MMPYNNASGGASGVTAEEVHQGSEESEESVGEGEYLDKVAAVNLIGR